MTSKIVVNNIEADAGVSTVTFGSKISATEFVGPVVGNVTSSGISTFSDTVNVGAGKSIRLYGATSGYSEIVAAAGSASTTFTLPANGGSASQYLQTDGAGALSWATVSDSGFASYAVIADQKTSGTGGGTFTSGAWRTRDLNTELFDPDGIVTISSNQFTLQAGSYLIKWRAPAYRVDGHRSALYDITGTAFIEYSMTMYANNTNAVLNVSNGSARVTIAAANTYEIQHRSSSTYATVGFGGGNDSFGDAETYTIVEIYREA